MKRILEYISSLMRIILDYFREPASRSHLAATRSEYSTAKMSDMKRILIIDDDCVQEEESIREGFAGTNIEVIHYPTKYKSSRWIKIRALFDCIVLDWYLEVPESPILSKQILLELKG